MLCETWLIALGFLLCKRRGRCAEWDRVTQALRPEQKAPPRSHISANHTPWPWIKRPIAYHNPWSNRAFCGLNGKTCQTMAAMDVWHEMGVTVQEKNTTTKTRQVPPGSARMRLWAWALRRRRRDLREVMRTIPNVAENVCWSIRLRRKIYWKQI